MGRDRVAIRAYFGRPLAIGLKISLVTVKTGLQNVFTLYLGRSQILDVSTTQVYKI